MAQNNGITPFKDECVIYYSTEDASWIAHSLNTDQMGFGDCVVDALVDLMVGLQNLLALAQKENVEVIVQAPPEIQRLRQNARQLPDCLVQIAKERFYHQLPLEWGISIDIPQSELMITPLPIEECYV
jgi:hypothetical protein